MLDHRRALWMGLAGLVLATLIVWGRTQPTCRVIESDPLGILSEPR